ncbi:phosphate ABC transporter ATP-binding protein PstB [Spirulina subsalsa FACHB-351]|uniref:Phosphate ABC transporter ATP-binding protein PstB n=1 Tax=Spirulina subsalsa FACHB-351 TaxID=234711 RepID=A0ABT3LB39_9CYAN|nr:phosphate ABC transporter ATP-binding protein PstB [Spirulina subsalsa]MCW6038731.1 phosphate ABC transporter ATP-binding protein PstB [Spirulina subsalsa FACHB-351]
MTVNNELINQSQAFSDSTSVIDVEDWNVYYGDFHALKSIFLKVPKNKVTAFIGPSGCGKSTLLRCFNRLNDLIPSFRATGRMTYHGQDLYSSNVDAVQVRRRIGMVFQKPNPFPKSIYDNIAYGVRVNGIKGDMDEIVEQSLRRAALWDEVKDKLKQNGTAISGGQQQRLCIARAIAVQPDVVLMDEPCASLDPISTLKIEELIHQLKENYTIVIVTHNMQQASRVADLTAFFNVRVVDDKRQGYLAEVDRTEIIFQNPKEEATQQYVSGRFG